MNLRCPIGCALLAATAAGVCAQGITTAYPVKPIRLLVGFAPGGGSDILGRMIAQKLNESWGYPVITDNRPGAGGTIAVDIAARSAPDGYTLLIMSGSQITNASLFTKIKSDVPTACTLSIASCATSGASSYNSGISSRRKRGFSM